MGQMLEGIADPANLAFAWGKVRANAGADGAAWAADPAGQTIAAFESDAEYQLAALRCAALRSGWHGKVASRGQGRIQGPRSHPGRGILPLCCNLDHL